MRIASTRPSAAPGRSRPPAAARCRSPAGKVLAAVSHEATEIAVQQRVDGQEAGGTGRRSAMSMRPRGRQPAEPAVEEQDPAEGQQERRRRRRGSHQHPQRARAAPRSAVVSPSMIAEHECQQRGRRSPARRGGQVLRRGRWRPDCGCAARSRSRRASARRGSSTYCTRIGSVVAERVRLGLDRLRAGVGAEEACTGSVGVSRWNRKTAAVSRRAPATIDAEPAGIRAVIGCPQHVAEAVAGEVGDERQDHHRHPGITGTHHWREVGRPAR